MLIASVPYAMKLISQFIFLLASLAVGSAFIRNRRPISASPHLRDSQKEDPIQLSVPVLRKLELTNANDVKVRLDQLMGPGRSVVVFLRHLG